MCSSDLPGARAEEARAEEARARDGVSEAGSCSLQQQQQQQQQRPSLVKQLLERNDRSQELEQKRLEPKAAKAEPTGDAMAAELEQKILNEWRDEDRAKLEAEGDAIAQELEKRLEREKAFSQARQILRHARAKFLARPSR